MSDTQHKPGDVIPEGLVLAVIEKDDESSLTTEYLVADLAPFTRIVERTEAPASSTPAPAPVDSTPAPAPVDSTPAPAPVDSTPAPAPVDTTVSPVSTY